ncbi:hypothetical protein EVAR_87501_1 [Eumeta japonica]|uniref:Uncharacterized protein n=1 Tax=Eumeta variegata TaxID=151549 RepID=A0A4C1W0A3_EUMVA|nr:hypothetical protein EVAR_87501_1 [Eumeta japonica]
MGLPMLHRCCGCLSLEHGSIILAIVSLAMCIADITVGASSLPRKDSRAPEDNLISMSMVMFATLSAVCNVLLLVGICTRRSGYMQLAMLFNALFVLFNFLVAAVTCLFSPEYKRAVVDKSSTIITFTIIGTMLALGNHISKIYKTRIEDSAATLCFKMSFRKIRIYKVMTCFRYSLRKIIRQTQVDKRILYVFSVLRLLLPGGQQPVPEDEDDLWGYGHSDRYISAFDGTTDKTLRHSHPRFDGLFMCDLCFFGVRKQQPISVSSTRDGGAQNASQRSSSTRIAAKLTRYSSFDCTADASHSQIHILSPPI